MLLRPSALLKTDFILALCKLIPRFHFNDSQLFSAEFFFKNLSTVRFRASGLPCEPIYLLQLRVINRKFQQRWV